MRWTNAWDQLTGWVCSMMQVFIRYSVISASMLEAFFCWLLSCLSVPVALLGASWLRAKSYSVYVKRREVSSSVCLFGGVALCFAQASSLGRDGGTKIVGVETAAQL
jgi:hypothetical protein